MIEGGKHACVLLVQLGVLWAGDHARVAADDLQPLESLPVTLLEDCPQ